MKQQRFYLAALAGLVTFTFPASAQKPPSYARDVKPFLGRHCLECHSADKARGGLNMESFKTLQAGGDSGAVFTPGKPDESRIVRLVEGKDKPAMPPKKAKQPTPAEVAVLRAWVAAGAKDDSASVKIVLPPIKPRRALPPPVVALAYSPDGKSLAAAVAHEVVLLGVANNEVMATLSGQAGRLTSLAFSPDGRRLAVASGTPGTMGELRLYRVPATGLPAAQPALVLPAHADVIHAIAWAPDGNSLATCGYDRLVKLWDTSSGKELRTLKDHSDAVYGLAFSPDGKLLASAGADRAVKVWDVKSGVRLYTLGESTDWVYAVAWNPDGKTLAAGGVDRSIRVWAVAPEGGRIVRSVFAHEGPVTRLAYSADGKVLYSLSEDRSIKSWDTDTMVEHKVYPRQPETTLALAVRPDRKQLALGRYDGAVLLLEESSAKVQAEPLPVKPSSPQLTRLSPSFGQRGRTVRLTFEGKNLHEPLEFISSLPSVTARFLSEGKKADRIQADVEFPATAPAGVYEFSLKNPVGQSAKHQFTLDLFAALDEKEPNESPTTGQPVTLPATLVGAIGRAGEADYYRFDAQAGQEIGVQAVTADLGSKLDPVLTLTDAAGNTLAETGNGVLGYKVTKAGSYAVGIRDKEYRGNAAMNYRLHLGSVPVVTSVFPLGVQRGTEADVHLEGVHLGGVRTVRVKAPASAAPGTMLPVTVETPQGAPLGKPTVVVGEFPETIRYSATGAELVTALSAPGTGNGVIRQPGAADLWRFAAKKNQTLIVEVKARPLGSPLDSYIEILDAKGQPVSRATLRSLAQTFVTFRDHDSADPAIRIETWSELAINDTLYLGGELLRIRALPKNPDDNCLFVSKAGQRVGLLDTTPTHHSVGTPMYKVAVHPPGTVFPPNGFPVVTLYYRNDDGGPGYGKDSRLFFDAPADGEYQVRVGDSRGLSGPNFAYRLTVRPPRPRFNISFSPTSPSVWKGNAVPVTVTAERTDGFDGPIDVRLENLPSGFSAPVTSIPAGEESTAFALYADPKATTPTAAAPIKLVARASIDGKEIIREATGGVPKAIEPGDLATTTETAEVTIRPGGEVRLKATVERRKGFKGRVPLDVRGLPHGVRVLDIGLNGILITEKDSSRTFVIYAEPWVKPMTHPFVVLAKGEAKNTEHAAKSVLLRVAGPDQK